ncbi:UDP-glycosyltransferase family, conserved site [Sesbania bispinosa]|nr:UDP-glycosyltransferase family, conserved site [Sesbania bispinosa]
MVETIVLYPAPAFHHLVSMVELGKLVLKHQPELSITILVSSTSLDDPTTTSSYLSDHSQANFPISFISLPLLQLPHSNQSREAIAFESIDANAVQVLDALQTLSCTSTILALVTSAPHEILNTNIPTYCYFSSCASTLAFFLHLPTIHNQTTKSFHELDDTLFNFPGLPTMPASYMPKSVLNRGTPAYQYFLRLVACMLKSKGVIVNSFDLLEPHAIEAITNGACVPHDPTPPIFCIGPLVTRTKDHMKSSGDHCLAWLDAQPSGSVVFLCFGSRGVFPEAQLREIAFGLERSNQRFLWVVKSPQGLDKEPNLEELLPQGFLERTKERGLVMKSWAPQNAVLGHGSVGGFVTHCGWNSVLEAVSYGVPMVAWPLYAEQHMNSVVMVEEMKLAIPIREVSNGEGKGLVGSEEVERRVKQLMEMEDDVRERSLEMKEMAKAAWSLGGSSSTKFSKLLTSWKHPSP